MYPRIEKKSKAMKQNAKPRTEVQTDSIQKTTIPRRGTRKEFFPKYLESLPKMPREVLTSRYLNNLYRLGRREEEREELRNEKAKELAEDEQLEQERVDAVELERELRQGGKPPRQGIRVGNKPHAKLRILYINANGIRNKVQMMLSLISIHNPDVICITEAKVACFGEIPRYRGYTRYGEPRTRKGGGVVMWVKTSKRVTIIDMGVKFTELEDTWLEIGSGKFKTIIGTVYIPPGLNCELVNELYMELQDRITQARQMGPPVMLVGDFNAHVGRGTGGVTANPNPNTNVSGRNLITMVDALAGSMWNRLPKCIGIVTRKPKQENQQSNILDYQIAFGDHIECESMHIDSLQHEVDESDHCLMTSVIKTGYVTGEEERENKTRYVYGNKKVDWLALESDLKKSVNTWWMEGGDKELKNLSPKEGYKLLTRKLQDWAEDYLGGSKKTEIEIEAESARMGRKFLLKISKMRVSRRKLREEQRYSYGHNYRVVSEKIEEITRKLKRDESQKFEERIDRVTEELDTIRDPGHLKLFEMVKNFQQGAKGEQAMKDDDGNVVTNVEVLKTMLIKQWKKIFDKGHWLNLKAYVPPNQPRIDTAMTDMGDIREEEISKACKTLKSKKSAGLSDIPNAVLKHAPPILKVILQTWMQSMWESGTTPDEMGWGTISMLYKKGPASNLNNYRTLALGCNLCKLYLKVIEQRLRVMTEKYEILGDCQNGFRQGRRCQDNLYILNRYIQENKSKKENSFLAMLDITKAYDRVHREILWEKMEQLGYPARMMRNLKEIYRYPQGRIEFQGVDTGYLHMPVGLKQGCVLSPLLFAIYISDLTFELQRLGIGVPEGEMTLPGLLFADDMAFMGNRETILATFEQIGLFSQRNGIEFSGPKSQVIPINSTVSKTRRWEMGFNPTADGDVPVIVQETESARYLGILFRGKHSTFKDQAAKMRNTAKRMSWFVYSLANKTHNPAYYGGLLWKIYALPAITFGLEVIDISNEAIQTVEVIQRELARRLMRAPRHTHNAIALKECGLMPVQQYLDRLTVSFFKRAEQMKEGGIVHEMISREIDEAGSGPTPYFWDTDPAEVTDKKAKRGFFYKAMVAAKRLNISLGTLYSKDEMKDAAEKEWKKSIETLTEESDRLKYMKNDIEMKPWLWDINGPEQTWHRAKIGALMIASQGPEEIPCKECGETLNLQHMVLECRLHRTPDKDQEWIITRNGLGIATEEADIDPLEYWLQNDRTLAEKRRVGGFIKRQYARYTQKWPLKRYWKKYEKKGQKGGSKEGDQPEIQNLPGEPATSSSNPGGRAGEHPLIPNLGNPAQDKGSGSRNKGKTITPNLRCPNQNGNKGDQATRKQQTKGGDTEQKQAPRKTATKRIKGPSPKTQNKEEDWDNEEN